MDGEPILVNEEVEQTGGLLHGNNFLIQGGQFTQHNHSTTNSEAGRRREEAFKLLQRYVTPSAFHNSARRVDPPRCHQNTRKVVLSQIFDWISQDATRSRKILWLSGPAGAGKSAIAQSMAERCIQQKILVASLFFSHTDLSRNSIRRVVATLAYQLVLLIPATKDYITGAIYSNPLIFKQSFSEQFKELIVNPLQRVYTPSQPLRDKLVLIMDGIDECHDDYSQTDLICTIARFLDTVDIPLIVLFGSREDNHLQMTFKHSDVAKTLHQLQLDERYYPDDDIRLFLTDTFQQIKQMHPLMHLLDQDWPAPEHVQQIIDKSSGQFLYASVVMQFLYDPRSHPAQQLDIVRGLRPTGEATPFAQLDAIYRHVFSKVRNMSILAPLLAYFIFARQADIYRIAFALNISPVEVCAPFAPLTAVIACGHSEIRFLNASLPDFLLDKTRSKEYHLETSSWCTNFCIIWYQNSIERNIKAWEFPIILALLSNIETVNSNLRRCIRGFDPSSKLELCDEKLEFCLQYLLVLHNLSIDDGGRVYESQLKRFSRFLKQDWPKLSKDKRKEYHDIIKRLKPSLMSRFKLKLT